MNASKIVMVGTRIVGTVVGGCAGQVLSEALSATLPATNVKIVKVAQWIGCEAIGIYVGNRIEDSIVNSIRSCQYEEEKEMNVYVDVDVPAEA